MPVDLALVNYVQDLEALFAAVTGTTEIDEENKKQNVSVQSTKLLLNKDRLKGKKYFVIFVNRKI